MIEEHTCFCAQVQTWARSSRTRSARSNSWWPSPVSSLKTHHALVNNCLHCSFSPHYFFNAAASQRHAPSYLHYDRVIGTWSSTIHNYASLGVTISAGLVKTRASGARVASAQRQGRVTRRTMTRREFFIHLRAHDNFQRSLRVLDRVRGSARAKLAKPRESRH